MRVGLLLACVAAPLAGRSVRSRLENRVPAAAIPVVDSLVQVAGREGLPAEPLVGKALEGGAKHVVPALIVRAVETRLRSEEHTSELQSQSNLVCRLLLEKKKNNMKKFFYLLCLRYKPKGSTLIQ